MNNIAGALYRVIKINKCVSKTHISPYAQLIPGGVVHGPLKGSESYTRCL